LSEHHGARRNVGNVAHYFRRQAALRSIESYIVASDGMPNDDPDRLAKLLNYAPSHSAAAARSSPGVPRARWKRCAGACVTTTASLRRFGRPCSHDVG
jgi:hypothetical protein